MCFIWLLNLSEFENDSRVSEDVDFVEIYSHHNTYQLRGNFNENILSKILKEDLKKNLSSERKQNLYCQWRFNTVARNFYWAAFAKYA